jgi:hypothetical protein
MLILYILSAFTSYNLPLSSASSTSPLHQQPGSAVMQALAVALMPMVQPHLKPDNTREYNQP